MARTHTNAPLLDEVETVSPDELDEVGEAEAQQANGNEGGTTKAAKTKSPKRGKLPEGYVTPTELAKHLTERKLHIGRSGEPTEVKPQQVYSYIKNASADDPHPLEQVVDDAGNTRQALKLHEGIAWWERHAKKAAERREKAANKTTNKPAVNADGTDVVEVEDGDQGAVEEAE
jgi:hypothetical protein